jgi:hypothetical protein
VLDIGILLGLHGLDVGQGDALLLCRCRQRATDMLIGARFLLTMVASGLARLPWLPQA